MNAKKHSTKKFFVTSIVLFITGAILNAFIMLLILTSQEYSLIELLSTSNFGFFLIAWEQYTPLAMGAIIFSLAGSISFLYSIIKAW